MATYNGERYIRQQLYTIVCQLSDDDEIVVSDDGSTDRTVEIIKGYSDRRIRLKEGPCKGHPKYNFENALRHATGDIIFLADQDDLWMPGKLSVVLSYMRDYDLVVNNAAVINAEGDIVRDSFFNTESLASYRGAAKNLMHNHYIGCCMAFKREILEAVLPFPAGIPLHDVWIGLCAECLGFKTAFIPEKLVMYRRHGRNFSPNVRKNQISYMNKVIYRLRLLYLLYCRKAAFLWKRKHNLPQG